MIKDEYQKIITWPEIITRLLILRRCIKTFVQLLISQQSTTKRPQLKLPKGGGNFSFELKTQEVPCRFFMKGFLFNGMAAGIKKNGNLDLGIIYSQRPATAAALFTRNQVVAAPVILGRERIKSGLCQAVVVNSGNANCFTGEHHRHY